MKLFTLSVAIVSNPERSSAPPFETRMNGVAAQLGAFIVMACKPVISSKEPAPSTENSTELLQMLQA